MVMAEPLPCPGLVLYCVQQMAEKAANIHHWNRLETAEMAALAAALERTEAMVFTAETAALMVGTAMAAEMIQTLDAVWDRGAQREHLANPVERFTPEAVEVAEAE